MRWLHRLGIGRVPPDDSVAWEIEHHLAELVDRLVDEGWTEGDARAEAERRFGDPRRYGPAMRRMERGRMTMERTAKVTEVARQAFLGVVRTARRYPGFTAGVVLTMGLGIGANATMYGIVDRLLLQPPDHIEDHERVQRVLGQRPSIITGETLTQASLTYPDYQDLEVHSGMEVAGYHPGAGRRTMGRGETAASVEVTLASHDFFTILGVQPRLGRFYTAEEEAKGAQLTAVISEEFWKREYGADPGVLGRTVYVGTNDFTIIGVAPAGFTGLDLKPIDMWLPLEATYTAESGDRCLSSRGCWWLQVMGRLADGVTVEAAQSEATQLHLNGRADEVERGRWSEEAALVLAPVIAAKGPEPSAEAQVAQWLTGVSLIVLLIACANVANLLLARGTRQRREVAVRLALGGQGGRLATQMVLESVLLSLLGAGVALAVAQWGGGLVRSTLLPGVSFSGSAIDERIVLFTAVIAVLAGLVSGIAPALQASRGNPAADLVDAGRGSSGSRSRARSLLTVSQAAMSVVLLVGAGLFVRSLTQLNALDLGLDVDELLLVSLEFESTALDDATKVALHDEVAAGLSRVPGVASVAATAVPFQWGYAQGLNVPGVDSIPRLAGGGPYYFPVAPGYFETVGLRVLEGRGLEDADVEGGERVTVVSETMARSLWPEASALGQCMMVGMNAEACTTVVGVTEDAARSGYEDKPFMAYYLPLPQSGQTPMALYVRTTGPAEDHAGAVVSAARAASSEVRFAQVRSMREILDPQARSWTLGATMFTVFGLLALALAAIGLYSVLAFDVAQRTRELGIRTALGAEKAKLLRNVLFEGGRLAALGVVLGLAAAAVAGPYAADLLFEVSPRDPTILGGVALILVLVSVVASLAPGLRATRVDPLVALRTE